MAVTVLGSSIKMTATGDAYTGIVSVAGLNFQGTGLTAAQRLLVTDTDGSVIADYVTEAATDNQDLINGREPKFYQGIKIAAGTLAGAWQLSIILE